MIGLVYYPQSIHVFNESVERQKDLDVCVRVYSRNTTTTFTASTTKNASMASI